MSLDVGLTLPGDKAARQGSWTVTSPLAIVAVFVAAILLRQVLPFNVDVSWWLIVSERMLDGQRLYVDILETNPPTAGSVYFLAVALARALHLRPEVVTDALILGLVAASLVLTWRILRFSSLRDSAAGAPAVWAAADPELSALLKPYLRRADQGRSQDPTTRSLRRCVTYLT